MKAYLDALQHILDNGIDRGDRTGTGTRSVFGHQMRFNLEEGFPAVTTKTLAWKSVVSELLWFLEGSTDERRLAEIRYGKDRSELKDKTTIWTANADNQGVALGYENNDMVKELGPVYGKQWRIWTRYSNEGSVDDVKIIDQISTIISQIKNEPNSRRIILNAWNVGQLDKMSLPPCHVMYQFYVDNNQLSCMLTQRSADFYLGSSFNIASTALLTHMIAQICDLDVGELVYSIGDMHLYKNHIDQAKKQLSREPYALPELWLNPEIKNIDDFTMDDIKLLNYKHHPPISAPMAV